MPIQGSPLPLGLPQSPFSQRIDGALWGGYFRPFCASLRGMVFLECKSERGTYALVLGDGILLDQPLALPTHTHREVLVGVPEPA